MLDPTHEKVTWHNGSDKRVARYMFNTKTRDHMFCPKCGASIGIDFEKKRPEKPLYGISVRTVEMIGLEPYRVTDSLQVRQFNNIDLDTLRYKKFDGMHKMEPAVDLSGKKASASASL